MYPDSEHVIQIIRKTAEIEILPRFRSLLDGDIREKNPGDLVTVADIESEKRLTRELMTLYPGSVVVGEEACEEDPDVVDRLNGDAPVWIVDPVDGTHNFAHGKECFAVIVCLVHKQITRSAWIYDPIKNVMIQAHDGKGAWDGDQKIEYPSAKIPVSSMRGGLPAPLQKKMKGLYAEGVADVPEEFIYYRCAGQEYSALARGEIQFLRFAKKLKPWDHAAGVLIHHEAGGYSATRNRITQEVKPYSPAIRYSDTGLLMTSDEVTWNTIEAHIKR